MVNQTPKLSSIQAALRARAQDPKGPTILELLRQLRPDLKVMLDAGHRGTTVYRILRQEGCLFSQQAFYSAWSTLLTEEKWGTKHPGSAAPNPTGVANRSTPPVARPTQITPTQRPMVGSALEAVQRMSATELLRQSA